ncbi:hypothetical protein MMC11_007025 [Xylographa trunciseda]|nr:hypothetical protein [Xylographa trunciseda]
MSGSPFWKLPVEIRVMIYHLVLDLNMSDKLKRYEINKPIPKKALSLTRSGRRIRKSEVSYYERGTPRMAIVFTCRQVYVEAGPLYYASRIFEFFSYKCMSSFISALGKENPFSTFNLDAIRHISIRGDYGSWTGNRINSDELDLIVAAALLIPRLHYIEIFVLERFGSEEWNKMTTKLAYWCARSQSWRHALLIGANIDLRDHKFASMRFHPPHYWRKAFLFTCDSTVYPPNWKFEPKYWDSQYNKIVEDTLGLNHDDY